MLNLRDLADWRSFTYKAETCCCNKDSKFLLIYFHTVFLKLDQICKTSNRVCRRRELKRHLCLKHSYRPAALHNTYSLCCQQQAPLSGQCWLGKHRKQTRKYLPTSDLKSQSTKLMTAIRTTHSTTVQVRPVASQGKQVLLVHIICAKGCTTLSSESTCMMDADKLPQPKLPLSKYNTIAIKVRRLHVSNNRVGTRENTGKLNQTLQPGRTTQEA